MVFAPSHGLAVVERGLSASKHVAAADVEERHRSPDNCLRRYIVYVSNGSLGRYLQNCIWF